MAIIHCPHCGMATVAAADQHSPPRCEHCGQPLDGDEPLAQSDPAAVEVLVRERIHERRRRRRRRWFRS